MPLTRKSPESYDPAKLLKLCDVGQELLGICKFDGVFEYMNPAWTDCLGWEIEELTSRPFLEFVHPDDVPATVARFEVNLQGHVLRPVMGFTNRYRTKAGSYRHLRWATVTDLSDKLIYSSASDVTDFYALIDNMNQVRQELADAITIDTLTELPNRKGGLIVLEREAARVVRLDQTASIVKFDIDYMKKLNSTHSRQVGDMVIVAIASTLKNEARAVDYICRWNGDGDEFMAILPGVDESGAENFAQRMLAAVATTRHPMVGRVTMSAGVAELRKDEDFTKAMARAKANLTKAKEAGRGCVGR